MTRHNQFADPAKETWQEKLKRRAAEAKTPEERVYWLRTRLSAQATQMRFAERARREMEKLFVDAWDHYEEAMRQNEKLWDAINNYERIVEGRVSWIQSRELWKQAKKFLRNAKRPEASRLPDEASKPDTILPR